jgi:hypothetical protein
VGAGGDEFGDGMGEGGVGVYVKDREGVFAVIHAAFAEDDAYEMNARGAEEGQGCGFGEELGLLAWKRVGGRVDVLERRRGRCCR